jgi:hypothetical protein
MTKPVKCRVIVQPADDFGHRFGPGIRVDDGDRERFDKTEVSAECYLIPCAALEALAVAFIEACEDSCTHEYAHAFLAEHNLEVGP